MEGVVDTTASVSSGRQQVPRKAQRSGATVNRGLAELLCDHTSPGFGRLLGWSVAPAYLRPNRRFQPQWVTRRIASMAMALDIFDVPASLSRNRIGTSVICNPASEALHAIST